MKQMHPGDNEIQCFVFERSKCKPSSIEHIRSCELCSSTAAFYASLAEELQQSEKPSFEFNVAEVVMPLINHTTAAKNERWIASVVIFLLSVSLIFTAYFFGNSILTLFKDNSVPATALIIGTACLLTFFGGLDMYTRYKRQMHTLKKLRILQPGTQVSV